MSETKWGCGTLILAGSVALLAIQIAGDILSMAWPVSGLLLCWILAWCFLKQLNAATIERGGSPQLVALLKGALETLSLALAGCALVTVVQLSLNIAPTDLPDSAAVLHVELRLIRMHQWVEGRLHSLIVVTAFVSIFAFSYWYRLSLGKRLGSVRSLLDRLVTVVGVAVYFSFFGDAAIASEEGAWVATRREAFEAADTCGDEKCIFAGFLRRPACGANAQHTASAGAIRG